MSPPSPPAPNAPGHPCGLARWWVYQRERFPLLAHGPLIACFSFCAVSYSSQLRGAGWPEPASALTAFGVCLLSFLHLRLADEFKDFEEDSRYRPYRPVPRGLVTLRELGWLWVGTALLQILLTALLQPLLLPILLLTWTYLALMSKEFFAREWLKARPFTYLWTHMFILPLIDFFATACDWVPFGDAHLPGPLFVFLLVSFGNGVVIEIGRKIRAPADEETGVATYSVVWGRTGAVRAWWFALALTALCATFAAAPLRFALPAALLYLAFLAAALVLGLRFLRHPAARSGRRFETLSGLWTLALYLSLGLFPLLLPRP